MISRYLLGYFSALVGIGLSTNPTWMCVLASHSCPFVMKLYSKLTRRANGSCSWAAVTALDVLTDGLET